MKAQPHQTASHREQQRQNLARRAAAGKLDPDAHQAQLDRIKGDNKCGDGHRARVVAKRAAALFAAGKITAAERDGRMEASANLASGIYTREQFDERMRQLSPAQWSPGGSQP
jgi:hypothetical protein